MIWLISESFHKLAIDIVGPLPTTASGNRFILTMTDLGSEFPEATAFPSDTAAGVATTLSQIFFSHWFTGSYFVRSSFRLHVSANANISIWSDKSVKAGVQCIILSRMAHWKDSTEHSPCLMLSLTSKRHSSSKGKCLWDMKSVYTVHCALYCTVHSTQHTVLCTVHSALWHFHAAFPLPIAFRVLFPIQHDFLGDFIQWY